MFEKFLNVVSFQYPCLEAVGNLPDILKKALLAFDKVSCFCFFTFIIFKCF